MILWKVITEDRLSATCKIGNLGKYIIKYPPKTIIKAKKETLGIFCFSRKKYAIDFIKSRRLGDVIIIKVNSMCRTKRKAKFIPITIGESYFDLYYIEKKENIFSDNCFIPYNRGNYDTTPKGTVLCKKIYTLE